MTTPSHISSVQTGFLTISFNNAVAVVANIPKQLSVARREKHKMRKDTSVIKLCNTSSSGSLHHGLDNTLASDTMHANSGCSTFKNLPRPFSQLSPEHNSNARWSHCHGVLFLPEHGSHFPHKKNTFYYKNITFSPLVLLYLVPIF